jgi:type VI protein secretion system component Hcp
VPGVTGGSRDARHPGWFELSQFGFSVTAGSSGATWTLGFTTLLSQGVDQLYTLASNEQATDGVQLAYAKLDPSGTTAPTIFTLALHHAVFASSSTSAASSTQAPGVTFTLTFGAVDMTFDAYDDKGLKTETTGTWDLQTNQGGGGGPGPQLQFSVGSGGHSHILDVTSFLPPSQSAGGYGSGAATLPLAVPAPEVLSDIILTASGKVVANGVGELWKLVAGSTQDYATYSFTNATVQSVSISGTTATVAFGSPSVSFTLANLGP